MKVLWFSNSPGNAIEVLKDSFVGSSWIPSLNRALQQRVELHIAFIYPKRSEDFVYGETTYHSIGRKNWKLNAFIDVFWKGLTSKKDLKKFLDVIDKVKPDLIHIHGTENTYGCIIPHVSVPVVISIQGCLTVIERKYSGDYSTHDLMAGFLNFQTNLKRIIFEKSYLRKRRELKKRSQIERIILMSTQHIIGRTNWDRRVTSVLSPSSKYYHCDEIMREVFYKYKWEPHNRKKVVIHSTIGPAPYKGFETICEALYGLLKNGIELEWQVAGICYKDNIVSIAKRRLKDRFPLHGLDLRGKVSSEDLVEMMCEADLYVSTSHIENSPNSLCEAMLLGMPCITTFAGGTGSLLTDGVEGIIVQDGDPWVIQGAIIEMVRNPTLAFQYGKNAREKAILRHNPDKIVADLIKIYKSIHDCNYN